jgi:hypothetical protein
MDNVQDLIFDLVRTVHIVDCDTITTVARAPCTMDVTAPPNVPFRHET